jgi:endonuclease/exonuclease/phosphatase family metal-dependent hydrolase
VPVLRVLSYNVRYFGHATRGIASTRRAMARIADAIASLDPLPAIVCLQEVETISLRSTLAHPRAHAGQTQLEQLSTMLDRSLGQAGKDDGYEAYYFPAHAYGLGRSGSLYTTGLAILAHRDLHVSHHNATGPADITCRHVHAVRKLKQTRICAHVRFSQRAGHTIDVFNTHLSLPTTLSREFWTRSARLGYGPNQLVEAKNLARFVHRERVSDRYVIVGDFNSLPGSPVYRYLVEECGLVDPFARLHQMSEEDLRSWPTAGFLRLRMHLDYFFTGPALTWLDFDDSHPFGQKHARFHGLSDHVPLLGRCRVVRPARESRRPRAGPET